MKLKNTESKEPLKDKKEGKSSPNKGIIRIFKPAEWRKFFEKIKYKIYKLLPFLKKKKKQIN